MSVRIKDVALRARVSIATVSYVLNNKIQHSISQETVTRVREAAHALNYHPNADAQRLARRRAK